MVTGLYVFGSFARGALAPHDLDIAVEFEHDDEWISHFVSALSYGRDPHSPIRRMLTGGKRGCQVTFNFREQADFDLTMLWHKGDSLAAALARLDAIGAVSIERMQLTDQPPSATQLNSRGASAGPVEAVQPAVPGGCGEGG
jgi:hypothetical protein